MDNTLMGSTLKTTSAYFCRNHIVINRTVMWLLVCGFLMVFFAGCGSDNRKYPDLPHDHPLNTNLNNDFEKRKNIKFRH